MRLGAKILRLFSVKDTRDALVSLEDLLLEAGLAPALCRKAIETAREEAKQHTPNHLLVSLRSLLSSWIVEYTGPPPSDGVHVCLFVGVNGVGKTTTIAKYAYHLIHIHNVPASSITCAASDTFRAAAVSQLQAHARALGIDCIRQHDGADPSAVTYDALSFAQSRNHRYVLADSAGRMHTRKDLVAQLQKTYRVIQKIVPAERITVFMVLDGNTGLSSIQQTRIFREALPLSACIFTKYDGSTRGGVLISIAQEHALPCAFLGVGERHCDLKTFEKESFLDEVLLPR